MIAKKICILILFIQRKGLYPPPPGESEILGLEAAGTIEKIGSDCTGSWKVGDRVMALLTGKIIYVCSQL